MPIKFSLRDMTDEEFKEMNKAFDEYSFKCGNPPEKSERITFVAMDGDKFIGCASGLSQKTDRGYNKYFFLSDLLVLRDYRNKGIGRRLLMMLENKIKSCDIKHIWTWTAEYEAPDFYKKQGYKTFTEFQNWYDSGDSRIGLIKDL